MKKFFRYVLVIIVFGILNSCQTGRHYERPPVQLPEKFTDSSSAIDSNSIGDLSWKNYFSDPVLTTLIDSGLSRNFDLQYALKNISIAESQVKQANALWYPQLSAGLSAQYNRFSDNGLSGGNSGPGISNRYFDYTASLSMSWEIDIWGKFPLQKQASRATFLQNIELAKAAQTRLVADIANGYFSLLMLDQQLLQAIKTLQLTIDFVKLTRLLYDAGEVTYLGVQQAMAQRDNTAQLVPQIEEALQLQENGLKLLTGTLPGSIQRQAVLTDIHFNDSIEAGLPVALLSRRPDVRAQEMFLLNANAQVGIRQVNMYPALNLTAGAGFESIKASNWFNLPASIFGLVGGTLIQPILQRRQLKTQLEIARRQREQAVILFRSAVLNAAVEVTNALISIRKLKEQEVFAKQRSDNLDSAVHNAQLLFKNDLANYLEVIAAQQTALDAQLSLAFIQRSELNARVELYRSLGGGWK